VTQLAVLVAMLADLLTFVCALAIYPIAAEWNPVVRAVYTEAGLAGVVALKLGITLLALATIAVLRGRKRTVGIGFAVALPLAFAGVNTWAVSLA
jgi:hypothetical protein